jgi:hypothetical protein
MPAVDGDRRCVLRRPLKAALSVAQTHAAPSATRHPGSDGTSPFMPLQPQILGHLLLRIGFQQLLQRFPSPSFIVELNEVTSINRNREAVLAEIMSQGARSNDECSRTASNSSGLLKRCGDFTPELSATWSYRLQFDAPAMLSAISSGTESDINVLIPTRISNRKAGRDCPPGSLYGRLVRGPRSEAG